MYYENIEIGTSDFRTLIGNKGGNGISVEPVPVYFKNLPDVDGWIKLNCAISNKDGKDTIYYVDPGKIIDEPYWVRGCNSLGKPHSTIKKNYPHLMESIEVDVMSVDTFFSKYEIEDIGYLKIDTEGHDITILNAILNTDVRPEVIQFESNVLTNKVEYIQILQRLNEYATKRVQFDTICKLRNMERP